MLVKYLPALLADGRAAFEKRMRATCRITRITGAPVTDPDTGVVTPSTVQVYPDPEWPEGHPHADGRCYTRYPGLAFEQNPEVGTAVLTVSRILVRIPFGVAIRPGDVVEILTDQDNPEMAGTKMPVASTDDQSQATAQRLLCEDIQSSTGGS